MSVRGEWVTATYYVELDDGTCKSVYAVSQMDAEATFSRHLTRHNDSRKVVPYEPGTYGDWRDNCSGTGGLYA